MATTAPAMVTGTSVVTGASVVTGQGNFPIVRCRLSFDDVSVPTPTWTEVSNSKFRSFSTSHGRDSDFQEIDAGTATVVLDNRDRAYDPTLHAEVRPLNRVWLYEEFSGSVRDLFVGYVDVWDQQWPGGGWSDAVVELQCVDETKILALDELPATNPPCDSYHNLVASDQPSEVWSMDEVGEAAAATSSGGLARWQGPSPVFREIRPVTHGTRLGKWRRPVWPGK